MTTDHKLLNEGGESRNNHRYALVVPDLATEWIQLLSVQYQKISGDGKEFAKVSRAVGNAGKIPWNMANLVKNIMESL